MRKASSEQQEKYQDYLKVWPSCVTGELTNSDSKNNILKGLLMKRVKTLCEKTNIESPNCLKDDLFMEQFDENPE